MSIAELLDALSLAPSLPGANCKGRAELYDLAAGRAKPRSQVMQAQRDALELCRTCPALAACTAHIGSMPPWLRPRGVVAGMLNGRRAAAPPSPRHDPQTARTTGDSVNDNELGAQLRELRERNGWRQADVADRVGTAAGRVSQWETGAITPSLPILQKVADAFGLELSELLCGVRCEQRTSPGKGHAMDDCDETDINDIAELFARYNSSTRA